MKKVLLIFLPVLLLLALVLGRSSARAGDSVALTQPNNLTLVWPQDCTAINYDDFHSVADYLLAFAWYHVKDTKGYLLSLLLDKGGGDFVRWEGVIPLQYLVFLQGIAILPLPLDEPSWNALAPYVITWQVRALADVNDFTSVIAESPEYAFTMNPVVR